MLTTTSSIYAVLKQAILERSRVSCLYNGKRREFCPHSICTKNGQPRVLGWQFGGASDHALPNWRCMPIDGLSDVALVLGPWITGGSHSRAQSCITNVDIDVTRC